MNLTITLISSVLLGYLGYCLYIVYSLCVCRRNEVISNKPLYRSIISRLPKDLHFELCKYLYSYNHNYLYEANVLPEIKVILDDPFSCAYKFFYEYYGSDITVHPQGTNYENLFSDFIKRMSLNGLRSDIDSMIITSVSYKYNKFLDYLLNDINKLVITVSLDFFAYHYLWPYNNVKIKEIIYKYMISKLFRNQEDLVEYLEKFKPNLEILITVQSMHSFNQ